MRVRCPQCAHSFDHGDGRVSKLAPRGRSLRGGASKLPARSKKPKLRTGGAPQDPAFLAHVRTHACIACNTRAGVEAHHWGKRGAGQKCSDYETVPLCHVCHVARLHGEGELMGLTAREWRPRFRKWSAGAVQRWAWLGNRVLTDPALAG